MSETNFQSDVIDIAKAKGSITIELSDLNTVVSLLSARINIIISMIEKDMPDETILSTNEVKYPFYLNLHNDNVDLYLEDLKEFSSLEALQKLAIRENASVRLNIARVLSDDGNREKFLKALGYKWRLEIHSNIFSVDTVELKAGFVFSVKIVKKDKTKPVKTVKRAMLDEDDSNF